ncbi:hypothetical protein WEI85_12560 [Actinomycetes bacterium KLBMP 9797]
MGKQRDDDQTERMELHVYLEKERQIVADYQEGIKHFRKAIENKVYEIGRLDERLDS